MLFFLFVQIKHDFDWLATTTSIIQVSLLYSIWYFEYSFLFIKLNEIEWNALSVSIRNEWNRWKCTKKKLIQRLFSFEFIQSFVVCMHSNRLFQEFCYVFTFDTENHNSLLSSQRCVSCSWRSDLLSFDTHNLHTMRAIQNTQLELICWLFPTHRMIDYERKRDRTYTSIIKSCTFSLNLCEMITFHCFLLNITS